MYKEYLKEREDKEVLEREQGFAVYGFNCVSGINYPHVYIQDIYVRPGFRKEGYAASMADDIALMAKAQNIKTMVGSVDRNARGSEQSLQVLKAYGMRKITEENGCVWFIKEI